MKRIYRGNVLGLGIIIGSLLLGMGSSVNGGGCQQRGEGGQTEARQKKQLSSGADTTRYITGKQSFGGTGRYYMGREIAQVMGHLGASWLERPEREREEQTQVLVKNLDLAPTDVIADIGAGSGYFAFRMAPLVSKGKVVAEDIQPEMLAMIKEKLKQQPYDNIETVLGTDQDPNLAAESIDKVLMVDVYHEFFYPWEMMTQLVNALRPGGRVYLVEYRMEDPEVPIKRLHKMTAKQARKEMKAVGLKFVENRTMLPRQHILVFEKIP